MMGGWGVLFSLLPKRHISTRTEFRVGLSKLVIFRNILKTFKMLCTVFGSNIFHFSSTEIFMERSTTF
jgi:hypothetical protein